MPLLTPSSARTQRRHHDAAVATARAAKTASVHCDDGENTTPARTTTASSTTNAEARTAQQQSFSGDLYTTHYHTSSSSNGSWWWCCQCGLPIIVVCTNTPPSQPKLGRRHIYGHRYRIEVRCGGKAPRDDEEETAVGVVTSLIPTSRNQFQQQLVLLLLRLQLRLLRLRWRRIRIRVTDPTARRPPTPTEGCARSRRMGAPPPAVASKSVYSAAGARVHSRETEVSFQS